MVNIDKLKKLLNLSTSTYNGESLNAIRKANEELKKSGQTWDQVLEGRGSGNVLSYISQINGLKDIVSSKEYQLRVAKTEIEDLKRKCDIYRYTSETKKTKQHTQTQSSSGYIPKSKRGRTQDR
jgi:hypothetical protein